MENLFGWFLVHIFSPLLLPLFLIGLLCMVASVRPEPVIAAVLGIVGALFKHVFELIRLIVSLIITKKAPPAPRRPRSK